MICASGLGQTGVGGGGVGDAVGRAGATVGWSGVLVSGDIRVGVGEGVDCATTVDVSAALAPGVHCVPPKSFLHRESRSAVWRIVCTTCISG